MANLIQKTSNAMIPILRHTADSAGKPFLRAGKKYISRIYLPQKQRVMKTKTILFTVFALFLLIGGTECEREGNSEYEIITTGTLIYAPTGTFGFCKVRNYILKTNEGDIDLFIDQKTIDAKPFENKVVTIYGVLINQIHKQKDEFCSDVIKVNKILEN